MRASGVVLLLALAAGGAPAPALAAAPTLGATLGPVPVYADDPAPSVFVVNRSTVAVDVTLRVTGGSGYRLAVTSLALTPGQRQTVPVTAIGPGAATVTATFTAAGDPPVVGQEAVSIALATTIRHRTPLELAAPWWPLLGLLVLPVLWLIRRRERT